MKENISEMNNILLSVYIPTFNRCNELIRQLNFFYQECRELLEEERKKIEIILSDNHSEDDTLKQINEFMKKDNSFEVKVHCMDTNIGIVGNAYNCIELTQGKYIWVVSDDDLLEKGVIKKILQIINDEVDAIYLNTVYIQKVRDFTSYEVKYNGEEVLKHRPKQYMLENFFQRSSRMGLSTALVFKRKYMEIVRELAPVETKEAYGWGEYYFQ